jgi:hypothetical protein
MYEIRSESVKTFITDRSVKLPRFQRKQTWNAVKNFQLCISLFNEYPLGMCILSSEVRKGRSVRMLLDGRQRRNALTQMYDDPEKIYMWGIKFIGIKNNDQPADIDDKFNEKISEYIEAEFDEETNDNEETATTDEAVLEEDSVEEEFNPDENGLGILLQIIKICHNKYSKGTGFTRPFDLTKYVKKLPYVENDNGKVRLSAKRVKTFIDEYQKYCDEEEIEQYEVDSLEKYILSRCVVIQGKEKKFKDDLVKQWNAIVERMQIVDKIDSILSRSFVGIVEVKNPTPSDAQKIFNIINTGGEKLSAVEILSAKPHWNLQVDNPSETALNEIKKLYKRIGVESVNTVRWDYPATFYRRLGKNIIFPQMEEKDENLGKELTLGFKMIAAIKTGGVKKENIEELGKKNEVNWASDIDTLIEEFSYMTKLLTSFSYFKYFESWRNTIYGISSEAAAINFMTLIYMDWVRKGKPIGNDTKAKQFQKNCFILWDQTIYEYVNKQWKGAADQKTANNIEELQHKPEMYVPIEKERWRSLLSEIFELNSIDGVSITKDYMIPILYHMYCLKKIQAPDTDCEIEVDHILPQSSFNISAIGNKEVIQHNVLNLGLLPKRDNISKSNNKLIYIDDDWLKDQIVKYEFIRKEDFSKYSDITNYDEMFKERSVMFMNAFCDERDNILNN